MLRIYLSGDMQSGWQDIVKNALPQFIYYDPRDKKLDQPQEYTVWDLFHIAESNIVFAFMARDNPSGIGLAVECGYGKALGKLVILVDEKQDKYFPIVRYTADITFDSLDDGIRFLRELRNDI